LQKLLLQKFDKRLLAKGASVWNLMKKIQGPTPLATLGCLLSIAVSALSPGAYAQNASDSSESMRASSLVPVISLLLDRELAEDDRYITQQNTLLVVNAENGIFSNDGSFVSDSFEILQETQNGDLSGNPDDGSFEYLPDIDFVGNDTFVYQLTSSGGEVDQATVTIKVNGVPIANDDNLDLIRLNRTAFVNVINNDEAGSDVIFDGAQVVPVDNAQTTLGGRVSIEANGESFYEPPTDLGIQTDSFVYTLRDRDGDSDTATITWRVVPNIIGDGIDQPLDVAETDTTSGIIVLNLTSFIEYIELNGTRITLAELNTIEQSSGIFFQIESEIFGQFEVTSFNESTGQLFFIYDPTGTNQDHATAPNNMITETVSIILKVQGLEDTVDRLLQINITEVGLE